MIDPIDCRDLNEGTLIQCPICLEIPRFPIIFPCGHLECHSCYSSDFRLRTRRYGLTFSLRVLFAGRMSAGESYDRGNRIETSSDPESVGLLQKSSRAVPQPTM